jgi:hypothetical protein
MSISHHQVIGGIDIRPTTPRAIHRHQGMFRRGQEVTRRRLESRLAAKNGRPTSAETVGILPGTGTVISDFAGRNAECAAHSSAARF